MKVEIFTDFFLLRDPNVRWVVLGVIFMCASSAVAGCFTFLRKRALVGDAISHAILPGICLAFMLAQSKNPLILLSGAVVTGWLSLLTIDFITNRTRLHSDTALALVLSVFYGIGIFLLTIIQNSGIASQSGLDKFLFGKAAAMVREDVIVFVTFSLLLFAAVALLYQPFKLLIFDRDYAQARGFPVRRLDLVLSLLTVFAIAIGIQAVGVVLMAALLITPAAAARYWTDRLWVMLLLAAGFAIMSGIAGTFVSFSVPKMPTGPWIVLILSVAAVFSILFGSRKGAVAMWLKRKRHAHKVLRENILKCLYHLGESHGNLKAPRDYAKIMERRPMTRDALKKGLKLLQLRRLVKTGHGTAALTNRGLEEARRIVRIHRLWEIYISRFMHLPSDHVHEDAEAVEHIITSDLEKELESRLGRPPFDPHNMPIPYGEGEDDKY